VTFRTRLTVLCAAALAVALSAAIAVAYTSERSSLGRELDSRLRARAAQVTQDVVQEVLAANELLPKQRRSGGAAGGAASGGAGKGGAAAGALRAAAVGVGLSDLVLVTASGELAPASTSVGSVRGLDSVARAVAVRRSAATFRTFSVSGAPFRAYIFRAGRGVAGEVRAPLAQLDASLRELRLRFVLIALGAVLLVAVLAALVARWAMRPVAALTAAAESVVETGDLRARVAAETRARDELARLAQTMNEMLAALERSVSAQRQLVADASHELRTPLTTLITNLQLLDEPGGLTATDARELVGHARREAEGLAALVRDLVELARDRQVEIHVADVRLDLVAAAAAKRIGSHAGDVVIRTDLSPCTVRGDADLIDRAIGNLLDNAAKWTPPGGTVSLAVRDGEVNVTDEGPGFSEADLPHVFDRFYRSASARGQSGSGLGLAIVRQIADLHDGTVSASNAGRGASVRIVLPATSRDCEGEDTRAVSR
jgi:two-component system, OmpR family, sensor histidine kinase MprB